MDAVSLAIASQQFETMDPQADISTQYQGYGLVFTRASRYISRIYNRHLADVSLTVGQYGILASLANSGPVVLRDLAERLVIERSALLRTIQPLASAGFIQSASDPSNRRRLLYQLTEEGHRCLRTASTCIYAAEAEIEQIFERSAIMSIRNDLLIVANASRPETSSII
jgi:DNA-binding MarR family transcriptional regulator